MYVCMYTRLAAVLPEGSQAVGDHSRVQVVDNADSKEAEHGHAERRQPNAHRSHYFRENTLSGENEDSAVLTTWRRGGTNGAGRSDVAPNYDRSLSTPTCRLFTLVPSRVG